MGHFAMPHDATPRTRAWFFRILAVLLTLGSTLLLAEGAARVYARATGKDRALVFDPELGWHPLPNLSKTGDYWGVSRPAKTNSRGWRDAERAFDRTPGVRRALLLGDSFAFGLGVDDGDRVSDILGREIEGLEVLNMAVTAWGTDQQLRALETEGWRYSPDIVIVLTFPDNDLEDVRRDRNCSWPKPRFELVNGELDLVKPVKSWDIRLRSVSYVAEFVYSQLRTKDTDEHTVESWKARDTVPLYAAIVRRIAEGCKAHGALPVAVVAYPPNRFPAGPTEAELRARAALEEAGFTVCDTFDAFQEHLGNGEDLYVDGDFHWNARGNRVAADATKRTLFESGLLQ